MHQVSPPPARLARGELAAAASRAHGDGVSSRPGPGRRVWLALAAALGLGAAMLPVVKGTVASARPARGSPIADAAAPAQDLPYTTLFPARIDNLRRCDLFDATVLVAHADDLSAIEVQIGYDESILSFEAADVAPWLADRWSAYTTFPPTVSTNNVLYAAAADPTSTHATGSGEIARLRFRAVGSGQTDLDLHDVLLVASGGQTIPVTSTGAVVVVLDEDGTGCVETPTATATDTPGPSPTAGGPTVTPTPSRTPTARATGTAPSPTPTGEASRTPSATTETPTPGTSTGTPRVSSTPPSPEPTSTPGGSASIYLPSTQTRH